MRSCSTWGKSSGLARLLAADGGEALVDGLAGELQIVASAEGLTVSEEGEEEGKEAENTEDAGGPLGLAETPLPLALLFGGEAVALFGAAVEEGGDLRERGVVTLCPGGGGVVFEPPLLSDLKLGAAPQSGPALLPPAGGVGEAAVDVGGGALFFGPGGEADPAAHEALVREVDDRCGR